ncbi:ABC transporter protein, partial [Spraguea lophii 42_110]
MSSNIQSFTFSSINLKINKKTILSDLHGKIRSNKMTAIMGLSGAGKSSFLKILSGRFTKKHNGNINVNGIALTKDTLRKISGYVHQHDILPNYLTVGEYLNFNNKLRTRNSECPGIEALNLNNILDKKIGDTESGGISGG